MNPNAPSKRSPGRPPKPLTGPRGEIRADALYPVSVLLKKLGVGRNTLSSLRRRGLKVHHLSGKSTLVDGFELIEFLRKEWAKEEQEANRDE
jgi:hypothetical protein